MFYCTDESQPPAAKPQKSDSCGFQMRRRELTIGQLWLLLINTTEGPTLIHALSNAFTVFTMTRDKGSLTSTD